MSTPASEPRKTGWFSGMIDGAVRVFAFGGGQLPATPAPVARTVRPAKNGGSGRKIDMKGVNLQVQQLAADGHARSEIARRTALSQDTVALLLHLTPNA